MDNSGLLSLIRDNARRISELERRQPVNAKPDGYKLCVCGVGWQPVKKKQSTIQVKTVRQKVARNASKMLYYQKHCPVTMDVNKLRTDASEDVPPEPGMVYPRYEAECWAGVADALHARYAEGLDHSKI